jgi:hypothetical protein
VEGLRHDLAELRSIPEMGGHPAGSKDSASWAEMGFAMRGRQPTATLLRPSLPGKERSFLAPVNEESVPSEREDGAGCEEGRPAESTAPGSLLERNLAKLGDRVVAVVGRINPSFLPSALFDKDLLEAALYWIGHSVMSGSLFFMWF